MTRNEQEYYANINGIARALDRIANALENNNLKEQTANRAVDRILEGNIDNQDIQHKYLQQLVNGLDNEGYHEFCNEHCLPASDIVAVSNYITDLDYDEVLGIINDFESQNDLRMRYDSSYKISYRNKIKKSDDQANEDVIEELEDNDNDLRETARMYYNHIVGGYFKTKKDCILDYITNEFGSQGARYTDIIKFAFYLNNPCGPKFSYNDRGYYSQGMSGRNPYLIRGGKDHLVKGINKDNDERYFALSFVESATDYWKYIK